MEGRGKDGCATHRNEHKTNRSILHIIYSATRRDEVNSVQVHETEILTLNNMVITRVVLRTPQLAVTSEELATRASATAKAQQRPIRQTGCLRLASRIAGARHVRQGKRLVLVNFSAASGHVAYAWDTGVCCCQSRLTKTVCPKAQRAHNTPQVWTPRR